MLPFIVCFKTILIMNLQKISPRISLLQGKPPRADGLRDPQWREGARSSTTQTVRDKKKRVYQKGLSHNPAPDFKQSLGQHMPRWCCVDLQPEIRTFCLTTSLFFRKVSPLASTLGTLFHACVHIRLNANCSLISSFQSSPCIMTALHSGARLELGGKGSKRRIKIERKQRRVQLPIRPLNAEPGSLM